MHHTTTQPRSRGADNKGPINGFIQSTTYWIQTIHSNARLYMCSSRLAHDDDRKGEFSDDDDDRERRVQPHPAPQCISNGAILSCDEALAYSGPWLHVIQARLLC